MGFEIELIPDIQTLPGEYFCPVCRTLVYPNEAIQSQCTHLYCKPCLAYVTSTTQACPYDGYLVTEAHSKPLVESDKTLADTIGKVKVHCLYYKSGCAWQGPFSECTSHSSACPFGNSPVICNRCGVQIVHRQVHDHAQNCPGGNSQPQQTADNAQTAATSTSTASDQNQSVAQLGTSTSHAQALQSGVVTSAVQNSTHQATANSQAPATATASVPAPEQWYQQQYQQYYQQYPGYDAYQQAYQQYYPYQQQAVQQFQQSLPHLQGQTQPQVYAQSHLQPQALSQPQLQTQLQPQQSQLQTYPQPQPQVQPQGQSQTQPLQSHLQPQSQPRPQLQTQPQAPSNLQAQSQCQVQPQIASNAQPLSLQHASAPVVPQHQNVVPVNPLQQFPGASRPQVQVPLQGHPSSQAPQPHPLPNPQAQLQTVQPYPQQMQVPQFSQPHYPQIQNPPQPHSQVGYQAPPQLSAHAPQPQSQAQLQHLQHHQLQALSNQPNQSQLPGVQLHSQHPSSNTGTGHQPQALQQMQPGVPQPHSVPVHPSSVPLPPAQVHGQFAHQPPQMVHPQSHGPVPNQPLMSSQNQVSSMPPALQQQVYSHAQQPSHSVHQRPVMQSVQPMSQPYTQHLPFPGQAAGTIQNHPQGHFAQQQPMLSQVRPQAPLHLMQQNSVSAFHQGQPRPSQPFVDRNMAPNQGVPSQTLPPATTTAGFAAQSASRTSNQLQTSVASVGQGDLGGKIRASREISGKDMNVSGVDSGEYKHLKSEDGVSKEPKPTGEDLPDSKQHEELAQKVDFNAKDEYRESTPDQTVGGEGKEKALKSAEKLTETTTEEKIASETSPKDVDHSSVEASLVRDAETFEREKGKLQKDASDVANCGSSNQAKGGPKAGSVAGDHTEHGYRERSSSHSQLNSHGPGTEEVIGFQGKGNMRSSQPVPLADHSRHHLPQPMHFGIPNNHQRPTGSSMLHSIPPSQLHSQVPTNLPYPFRPGGPSSHGSSNLETGFPGPGPVSSYGRGLPLKSFELPTSGTLGPMVDAVPPFSADPQRGIARRLPARGPEVYFGPQPPNPLNADKFFDQRPDYTNDRQLEVHLPGLDRGPLGKPSIVESNLMRMNGVSAIDSSTFGFREERPRMAVEDRANRFQMDSTLHFDQVAKPFENLHHSKFEASSGGAPLKYHTSGGFHAFDDDKSGMNFSRSHLDFHGPGSGFGSRNHMERFAPRSPDRECMGGFGSLSMLPHGQLGHDDIYGRGMQFGEGSRPFNQPTDAVGSVFRGNRFSNMPEHVQRGDFDGPGGDMIGQNALHGHQWRTEFLGPRKGFGSFPGPENMGELPGLGNLSRMLPFSESFGVNKSNHSRFDNPGFRSEYSIQGIPSGDGVFAGDMDPFDKSRKRKLASMGWCRICKVDCITVDGLDLHTQTKEHQKMAMDMVMTIKQKCAKKQKTSNSRTALEEGSKARNANFGSRGKKA